MQSPDKHHLLIGGSHLCDKCNRYHMSGQTECIPFTWDDLELHDSKSGITIVNGEIYGNPTVEDVKQLMNTFKKILEDDAIFEKAVVESKEIIAKLDLDRQSS